MSSVEEYGQNFKSLWDMVEAFGDSPGVHEGLVETALNQAGNVATPGMPMDAERKKAMSESLEAVKATLLINGANNQQYAKLKDELANNYLLSSDQYPDTCNKALRVLGNYQVSGMRLPAAARNKSEVAFLQQSQQGHGGRGAGGNVATGQGASGADAGCSASVTSGGTREQGQARKTNQAKDSHSDNCGSLAHWAADCPELSSKQQAQLHMTVQRNNEAEEIKEGH
jgi:hypothetical protein